MVHRATQARATLDDTFCKGRTFTKPLAHELTSCPPCEMPQRALTKAGVLSTVTASVVQRRATPSRKLSPTGGAAASRPCPTLLALTGVPRGGERLALFSWRLHFWSRLFVFNQGADADPRARPRLGRLAPVERRALLTAQHTSLQRG